jgi:hypothetical protein
MRPVLLLATVLFALPAWAQTSLVANAPSAGADFLRSDGAEPDTTSPWRYFPLDVGNAWEYYNYFTGERRRVDVYGTEIYNNRTYFSTVSVRYDGDGAARGGDPPGRALRYDTTAAAVWFYVHETGGEFPLDEASCPLNAAFGVEITCYFGETFAVGGGYDGLLAFGEPLPGTGEDTVRTAVKTYVYDTNPGIFYDLRYAADLGLVYFDYEIDSEGLYYARVDGVEHGVSVLPPFTVDTETGVPEPTEKLTLEVYPNPFRTSFSVEIERAEAGAVTVEVVDVLGRVVKRQELEWAGGGREVLRLDAHGLRAGAYLVRVRAGSGASAVQMVTKLSR